MDEEGKEEGVRMAAGAQCQPLSSAAGIGVESGAATLEQVYAAHHQRVFRAAYRITGNTSDAEDALQTVFLRLLRQGWSAASVDNVAMYLHRAGVNAALDVLRLRRDSRQLPLDELESVLPADASLSPERRHSAAELRAALRQALARINPQAAEMFVLRYFEGYDNPEIARMLGTSTGNVAVTLHRVRVQLQTEMRSHLEARHEH
ncbi:MAG: RNA polymerase sigma factor [Bryobacteraceae bacterium]